MPNDFHIGDMVYAGDWCYGEIVRIENGYADVEYDTGSGGGCLPFELSELTHAEETNKEIKHCEFCCCLDFVDSNGEMRSYPKENYNFYAGYSKQIDVDNFDEFETENINYCPICGRKLNERE